MHIQKLCIYNKKIVYANINFCASKLYTVVCADFAAFASQIDVCVCVAKVVCVCCKNGVCVLQKWCVCHVFGKFAYMIFPT